MPSPEFSSTPVSLICPRPCDFVLLVGGRQIGHSGLTAFRSNIQFKRSKIVELINNGLTCGPRSSDLTCLLGC